MKIIDTHSHLYLEEFDTDRALVVSRAQMAGVAKIVLPAINMDTMSRLESMCADYPGYCFPTIGLHPEDVRDNYVVILDQMEQRLKNATSGYYIGIGEIGLDFYWDTTYKKEQLEAFDRQLQWAVDGRLPVIIHCRNAHREMVDTLYKYRKTGLRGIFHCFSGDEEQCAELLQFEGFLLGVGGVLTFKKSTLPSILSSVPLSRIVVETDSPYLAPVPHRGKRNESAFVRDVVCFLATSRNLDPEEVARTTYLNAERLFWG